MHTKETDFETIWWEMEEIEPLTPSTTPYDESNEVPTQSTNWLRVLERKLF